MQRCGMRKLGRIKKFGIEWLGWHGAFDGIYGGYNSQLQYLHMGPVMLSAYWKIPRTDVAGQFCPNCALDWPEWRRMLLAARVSDHWATLTAPKTECVFGFVGGQSPGASVRARAGIA